MKMFKNYEEYSAWTERFENCSDYEGIPVAIDDGNKVAMDMFTECKSCKTALRRFLKTFGEVNGEVKDWVEGIRESCENGYFSDRTEYHENGAFSWGVEEIMEGYWYVFLNISGVYAGREAC